MLVTLLSSGCADPACGPTLVEPDPPVPDGATKADVYAVETEWTDVAPWPDIYLKASCGFAADIAIGGASSSSATRSARASGPQGWAIRSGSIPIGHGFAAQKPASATNLARIGTSRGEIRRRDASFRRTECSRAWLMAYTYSRVRSASSVSSSALA